MCTWTPQCSDNLAFSQPRQILILQDMPLPTSFLCLSPSYLCHIPSSPFPPPRHRFPTRTVHHETTITALLTCWVHRGLQLLFFCPAASVSLSVSLPCLPVSACFCLAVFHFCLSSLSNSAPMGVYLLLCPPHQLSLWFLLNSHCTFGIALPFNFFILFQVLIFNFLTCSCCWLP